MVVFDFYCLPKRTHVTNIENFASFKTGLIGRVVPFGLNTIQTL